jgi:threonine/homoserine/homoserine lactone efflux protein
VSAAALGIVVVALGMALTPGPNMVYLVSRSVSQGRGAGMVSLLGTAVGFVVYMSLANLGLAAVFVYVPVLYVGLKAAGAAYLLWLAWRTLTGHTALFETGGLSRDSRGRLFRMGLVTNLLNPKAAVMYLALIPQFVDPAAGHVVLQGFALGSLQIATSFVVNTVLILLAGTVAAFLAGRPTWQRWQRRVTASLLGAVGVRLALDAPARA